MNYAEIKKNDIANGTGIRVSLFVSGCEHHCKNCFNQETWDFNYGKEYDDNTLCEIIHALNTDIKAGLTVLGGEPLHSNNIDTIATLCQTVKFNFPKKSIWIYTGYTLENLAKIYSKNTKHFASFLKIMKNIDILVDGPFIEELKNIRLNFRGSSNQRLIDIKKTKLKFDFKTFEISLSEVKTIGM